MKILFVGHDPYLSYLLNNLIRLGFCETQSIDVIIVTEIKKRKLSKKKILLRFFKRLKKISLSKLRLVFTLRRIDSSKILDDIFPEQEMPFGSHKIDYHEYERFFDTTWLSNFDKMIVATYGGLIAPSQFESPKNGTWNIHPSVLPQLKGGYPTLIQALSDEYLTGTTIHEMTERIDEGEIVYQIKRDAANGQNNHELLEQSAVDAASMLFFWQKNNYQRTNKIYPNLPRSTCKSSFKVKWHLDEVENGLDLERLVKAFHAPHLWPFIYIFYKGYFVQLVEVEFIGETFFKKRVILENFLENNDEGRIYFRGELFKLNRWIVNGILLNGKCF